MQKMRVFAGKHVSRCGHAVTARCFVYESGFSPSLSTDRRTEFHCFPQRNLNMRSAKTIATLASVAAAPTGKFQAKDSWGQQQIADQADEARLKRKLMICRSCLPGETVHEDTAGTATR